MSEVHSYNPFAGYASPKQAEAEAKANRTPTGLVPEIKEWVGKDKERAERALESENINDRPRKGLVAYLEEIISE